MRETKILVTDDGSIKIDVINLDRTHMNETKILVTDDLIDKYRSKFDLNSRNWQSEHVRGYVLALSRQLTICAEMSWQHNITDITAVLARYEPLHELREHDYGGNVLWIAYNWYCARDIDTTRGAIKYALRTWPEDERLVRMLDVVALTCDARGSAVYPLSVASRDV